MSWRMRWQKVVAWWSLLVAAWAGVREIRRLLKMHRRVVSENGNNVSNRQNTHAKVIDVTSKEVK